MGSEMLLLIAVLPAIILLFVIYFKDKEEKEPGKLLATLFFVGGICSIILTLVIDSLVEVFIPGGTAALQDNIIGIMIYAFIIVACVEEGSKYIFLNAFTWKDKNFNYLYDGVVYASFVSLGFATLENVLYVFENGFLIGIARALLSVPGHLFFGIFMGYFYGLAKIASVHKKEELCKKKQITAYLVPVLLHGFFDFCLLSGEITLMIIYIIFVIVLYVIAFRKVNQLSMIRHDIYGNVKDGGVLLPKYCSNCGNKIENAHFCSRCGTPKENS